MSLVISALLLSVFMPGVSAAGSDVSVWDGSTVKSIATGSGTETDPYIITKAAELDYIATACMSGDNFAGKYIKLGVNINWGGLEWTSIGYSTTTVFSGNFDGNGKTIFNLTCKDVTTGIFAYATNATIKNLNVDYATFTTDTRYAGAIVGLMRGCTVSGCSAGENVKITTTDMMSNTAQIGGLFGLINSSYVDNCTFYGEVIATSITGTSFVGGIAGVIGNVSEVSYCINYGRVSVPNPCTVTGSVANVGGIAGGIGSSSAVGAISNCINLGEVTAVEYAGGVLGRVHVAESTMTDCYSIGKVTSSAGFAGAIVGDINYSATISGCYGMAYDSAATAYARLKETVTVSSDALKLGTEAEIKELSNYKKIIDSVTANIPVFDKVEATDPVVVTTVPVETTDAPVVTTEPTVNTTAPVATTEEPAVTTEAPTTEAPVTKGGCGAVFSGGVLVLSMITASAALVIKQGKE